MQAGFHEGTLSGERFGLSRGENGLKRLDQLILAPTEVKDLLHFNPRSPEQKRAMAREVAAQNRAAVLGPVGALHALLEVMSVATQKQEATAAAVA
jgi:hypothetical protein